MRMCCRALLIGLTFCLAPAVRGADSHAAPAARRVPQVAALVTAYFHNSHADVIVSIPSPIPTTPNPSFFRPCHSVQRMPAPSTTGGTTARKSPSSNPQRLKAFRQEFSLSIIGATANRRRLSGIIERVVLLHDGHLAVADGPVAYDCLFSTIAKPLVCRYCGLTARFLCIGKRIPSPSDGQRLDFTAASSFNFRWRTRPWPKWKSQKLRRASACSTTA